MDESLIITLQLGLGLIWQAFGKYIESWLPPEGQTIANCGC